MLYDLLKFLHILAVIVWMGGLISLAVIMGRLSPLLDQSAGRVLSGQTMFFVRRVLGPAAGLTLITGLALGGILKSFPFWMIWGIVTMVIAMAIGGLVQRRAVAELGTLSESAAPSDPRLAALRRRLAVGAMAMVAVLLTAVWAMVFKPVL